MKMSLQSWVKPAAVLALAALMATGAAAQGAKIGAVNVDRILRDSTPAKAATAKLEQEFSKREKELQTLAAQVKSASEKLEREAPTLPESQRVSRQRQLVDQDRELQRKQRSSRKTCHCVAMRVCSRCSRRSTACSSRLRRTRSTT